MRLDSSPFTHILYLSVAILYLDAPMNRGTDLNFPERWLWPCLPPACMILSWYILQNQVAAEHTYPIASDGDSTEAQEGRDRVDDDEPHGEGPEGRPRDARVRRGRVFARSSGEEGE